MKELLIYRPDKSTILYREGMLLSNAEKGVKTITNISTLNNAMVSIMYDDESEIIYSGMPFILTTERGEK